MKATRKACIAASAAIGALALFGEWDGNSWLYDTSARTETEPWQESSAVGTVEARVRGLGVSPETAADAFFRTFGISQEVKIRSRVPGMTLIVR